MDGKGKLRISVTSIDGLHQVDLAGDVDFSTAPRLRAVLEAIDGGHVTVDLGAVTFVDSSGLSALIAAHLRAAHRGERFTICNPRPQVRRMLQVTALERLFDITGEGAQASS